VRPRITDSAIAALTARTAVISDPAMDPTAIEPARVKIRLKDGRSIERSADTIKGSPQEPLTGADLLAKFHDCLEFGLSAPRAESDRLAEVVENLEYSTDAARDIVGAFPQSRPA
jgi:2-methylcitrate dehydratase PrpD